jgi:alkaline phosphatase
VAVISDSYINYSSPPDSIDTRLLRLVQKVHGIKNLLRLWAIPDNPGSWSGLHHLGIDIINTDKVAECRKYFSSAGQ